MIMAIPLLLLLGVGLLLTFSSVMSRLIELRHPNIGTRIDIGGMTLNMLRLPAGPQADLPPIVFIHGASGNLMDQATAFRPSLEGRADLIFVDRPGHGYSDRGGHDNDLPDGQARSIARLLDTIGIDRAIIVGHSFGGAIAASFALLHPEKTIGILFLAPATHPWGGSVDWHYHAAALPLLGPVFSRLLPMPVGLAIMPAAISRVFAPNPAPANYMQTSGTALVLRPRNFRANAIDVSRLEAYVARVAPRYPAIRSPAIVLTGNADTVVAEEIHSLGLARDLPNVELLWIEGLGHKPDYAATDLAIAAIETLAGKKRDLQAMVRMLERDLSGQTKGATPAGATP